MSETATIANDNEARRNLKAEQRSLIATVRNDITLPFYTGVLMPTDDTLLQRGGGKGLKIYDEIERDTHAFSVLQKRKNELTAREWIVEPASKDAADAAVADFVRKVLKALPFDKICRDLLDATLKGFSVGEIVWMRDGAEIVPERIVSHDQRRFVFDEFWRLRLLTMEAMREGLPLPDRKFIVHRVGEKGNDPYGLGLGNRLFWPVLFKREGIAFWMTYLEKFASPTPVGKVPVGMSPDEELKVLRALEAIAQGMGITVPLGTELSFLEATRSGPASYEAWERYWDEQMSVCVLGETLSTVMGSVGSQAAATVHSEGKSQLIDSDGDLLADTLQATLIRWLVDFNFPGRRVPKVYRERPKNEEALGKAREQIAKAEKAEIDAFNAALRLVAGLKEADAIATLRTVSALASRMEDGPLKAILAQPRPRDPAEPTAPGQKAPGRDDDDPEPAFSFAAPEEAILDHAHPPDAVLDAFAPALDAAIADWLIGLRAALGEATDLKAVRDLLDKPKSLPAATRLVRVLRDTIGFANLVGRASVVAQAAEDGVSRGDLFGEDFAVEPGFDFKGAPFGRALDFMKSKVALTTSTWKEIEGAAHDTAFTVAGEMQLDVLEEIRAIYLQTIEAGTGLLGFEDGFARLIAGGKWTGDERLAKEPDRLGWRARIIFETNVATSHAAGRRQLQLEVTHVLPYWQYRHADTRTPTRPRLRHVRLHGLTLPADDPVWKRIYAPNGWRCTCGIRAVTAKAAERAHPNHRIAPTEDEIAAAVDLEWQHAPGATLDPKGPGR